MHCGGCANRVKNVLLNIKGVKEVSVSLEKKEAFVISKAPLNMDKIKQAIDDLGFTLV